jgi:DNA-binding response OmpR family regulator
MPAPRILIVDDDPGILIMLQLMLQLEGYDAVACDHPSEVLGKIQVEKFDLMLLDAMMPQLNGLEVLKRMQDATFPQKPRVILFTGSSDPSYRKDALQYGACDVMSKPFIKEELLARIQTLLGGKS